MKKKDAGGMARISEHDGSRGPHEIAIAVTAFLDETELQPQAGGLQRWCRDLSSLLRRKGLSVTVFQKASRPFRTTMEDGVQVEGICAPERFWGHWAYGRKLLQRVGQRAVAVFVSQELMLGCKLERAVAVNHGIWWDSDFPTWKRALNRRIQAHTLATARRIICVDTNYINWCHAEIPRRNLWREKLCYVPNYADEVQFSSNLCGHRPQNGRPLRILYPRRLAARDLAADGRGAGLFLEALLLLRDQGVAFEAEFAGPGALKDRIESFAVRNGIASQVLTTNYALDEMPSAYRSADIVVVPSTAHEGTSLAAVEAIAAGKPTVVTHIGGLPNLILNGVNGFVADLSAESLCRGLLLAAEKCGDEAWSREVSQLTARTFGKRRWETAVWSQLQESLGISSVDG